MNGKSVEIVCSECGEETLVRREPEYDGFKKVGERFICASCGHEYADENDVPFRQQEKSGVFGTDDLSEKVDVFRDDEKGRNCRHCRHYVVNPFIQRCGLLHREVQATDICEKFEEKKPVPEEDKPSNSL